MWAAAIAGVLGGKLPAAAGWAWSAETAAWAKLLCDWHDIEVLDLLKDPHG